MPTTRQLIGGEETQLGIQLVRGVTRHLSHETRHWVHDNETRFVDFLKEIHNDEIDRENFVLFTLKTQNEKKCRHYKIKLYFMKQIKLF